MPFYERGAVRIHYEEAGSGFPLLVIPGGGLNSSIASLASPFNPLERYRDDFRCVAADLRNANPGRSSGPLEVDRPWDAYATRDIVLRHYASPILRWKLWLKGGPRGLRSIPQAWMASVASSFRTGNQPAETPVGH